MMTFAPVSSALITRLGAKRTLMVGAAVLGCGYLVGFALMGAPWQLLVASCIASAGVGLGYAAMPTLILDAVPMSEAASAVGVNALMRSVGTTLAAATMATVLNHGATTFDGQVLPGEGTFKLCFVIGAAAAFLGAAIAATIPRLGDDVVTSSPPAQVQAA
jgi:MFS family permease